MEYLLPELLCLIFEQDKCTRIVLRNVCILFRNLVPLEKVKGKEFSKECVQKGHLEVLRSFASGSTAPEMGT